jgi:DNA recombination protein Rad52
MTFSPTQFTELAAPLSRDNVKTRQQAGRNVSYIEAWHSIAECNRIFGFEAWSSATQDVTCVVDEPRKIGKAPNERDGFGVTYNARVRITVVCGEDTVIRDGYGTGHGIDADRGQAHESAIKEAESDARKRALMTFGNQFGLALYDKTQANVVDEADLSRLKFIEECKASIERIGAHPDPADLARWWNSEVEKKKRNDFGLLPAETLMLKGLVTEKMKRPT